MAVLDVGCWMLDDGYVRLRHPFKSTLKHPDHVGMSSFEKVLSSLCVWVGVCPRAAPCQPLQGRSTAPAVVRRPGEHGGEATGGGGGRDRWLRAVRVQVRCGVLRGGAVQVVHSTTVRLQGEFLAVVVMAGDVTGQG
jgi:hypothetical protein